MELAPKFLSKKLWSISKDLCEFKFMHLQMHWPFILVISPRRVKLTNICWCTQLQNIYFLLSIFFGQSLILACPFVGLPHVLQQGAALSFTFGCGASFGMAGSCVWSSKKIYIFLSKYHLQNEKLTYPDEILYSRRLLFSATKDYICSSYLFFIYNYSPCQ